MSSIDLLNLDDEALALLAADIPAFEQRYSVQANPQHTTLLHELADQSSRLLEHNQWGAYLAVDTETRAIVGTCAFKAKPTADGVVEIAYFTFEPYEGRGYASAMALALVELARAAPDVRWVVAHTLPEPGPSPHILEKTGLTFVGEVHDPVDGLVWRWSMQLRP